MPDPGRLRHRVTLQAPVESADEYGGTARASWRDVALVWADVQPELSGRELMMAQQVESVVTHRVTLRYRSDVSTASRLVFQGRVLEVVQVIDPEERHRWLDLLCAEDRA